MGNKSNHFHIPKSFRKCLIVDDHGNATELLDPFRLYYSAKDNPIERPILTKIINASTDGGSKKLKLNILFVIAFFIGLILIVTNSAYDASSDLNYALKEAARSIPVYLPLAYGAFIIPWQLQTERRIRRRQITKAYLEHTRCPHCGYNLAGLTPDPNDNATTCPECASAWKLDPTSIANFAGDEEQARKETIRFAIISGTVMTLLGLLLAMYYIL